VRAMVRQLVQTLNRPANAPDWIGVYLDEAEHIAQECVHVPCIGWLIRFWNHRPIGCRLDIREWMTRWKIGNR